MHRILGTGLLPAIAAPYTAAGTTTITGATISHDESATGILYIVHAGALVAGQVTTAKVQVGDAADASDMADVTGLSYMFADGDGSKLVLLELNKPLKKYSRVVITRGTQNATINSVIAIKHNQRVYPVPVTGDVVARKIALGK